MHKRGQHWSLEVMVSVTIFIIVFVGAIGLLAYQSSSQTKQVVKQSDVLVNQLYGNEDEILVLVKDGKLDAERLREIAALSEDEQKDLVGIDADFCILIRDPDTGDLIPIDNGSDDVVGIGSSNIKIGGTACGSAMS